MSMNETDALGTARLLTVAALAAACVSLVGLGGSLVACESATNLDVTFGDASAALEGGALSDGEATDGGEDGPVAIVPTLAGCPCDTSEGLGCCMPTTGKPFCTPDTAVCAAALGTLIHCVHPDRSSESACCWHGTGPGAQTALAATCDGGPAVCTSDSDCEGTGQKCAMALCFKGTIAIGACAATPPTCPQP
ncbi:MAG: hypothetical protein JWO86_8294 [Myxococcaceae bacterium]|nr:hypothetical protein [Myxococcaceae bacterium]MEA2748430.1 hypothetical protein [Myxococcales bacterium]